MPGPTSVPAEDVLRLPALTAAAPDFGPERVSDVVLGRSAGAVVQASPAE